MTVLEIMERAGIKNETLAIAYIKDALHLIQSNVDDTIKSSKQNIVDGTLTYDLPSDMIKIKSISVLDTTDSKYKRIKRLAHDSIITEDTDPE
tara:strand:+ start:134 stop:412 length:279 start_codon:yes stop_codon:yes gene_type:complete